MIKFSFFTYQRRRSLLTMATEEDIAPSWLAESSPAEETPAPAPAPTKTSTPAAAPAPAPSDDGEALTSESKFFHIRN